MTSGRSKKAMQAGKGGGLARFMPNGGNGNGYHDPALRADWSAVSPDFVYAAVVAVTRGEGAILFGGDRGGTQFAISLFYGGEKNTFYWSRTMVGASDLETWLANLISDLNSETDGA